jgi:uncharacterized protein (TIGR02246 family)
MNSRLLLSLLAALASPAMADVTDDVRCHEIRFSRSVETQDPVAFASFIDDDARFISDAVNRGPEAIATAWSAFFVDDGPRIKWRPQLVEVLEDGSLALSRGPYRMTVVDEQGNATEHWGTFNSVWRLQEDGNWKIVFDAGSPAASAPPDDVQALLDQGESC